MWKRLARLLQSGAATTRAEGLWRRYLLGLTLMMSLILSANMANRSVIELSEVDSAIVQKVGELQLLSQRILLLSTQQTLAGTDPDSLSDMQAAIDRFDALRIDLASGDGLTAEMQQALFAEPIALEDELATFVTVARAARQSLTDGTDEAATMVRLTALASTEVPERLDDFITIFTDSAASGIRNMKDLQSLILAAAIFVLVLEALFVYLPAHLTVKSALHNLRHRAHLITQKKRQLAQANRALSRAAKLDALTSLPNRTYLIEILSKALKRPDDIFHIVHIDIDRFRAINDASGEATGDLLLKYVANMLRREARKTDLVARTGGDEFVIITRGDPAELANRLVRHFQSPIKLGGRICQTGLCIGHTTRSDHCDDALVLLSDAELALKDAKNMGRGCVIAFTRQLRADVVDRDRLMSEIANAMEDGHVMPFYQPQIDLKTGALAGVEVLARWVHPIRGQIAPDNFLPLAAAEGLARDLDYVIWRKSMAQLVRWRNAGLSIPHISLNAGPDTIADPDVVGNILELLKTYGLSPQDLAIEVLETTFIGSIFDMAAINIDRLIAAGITVELDDFGTGYTSLSTLISLKLSAIKLDRSLVAPLPSPRAESILRAVMALATEMKLQVVAEGIETPAQAQYLREIGCQTGQGYGFGKPMPAREFAAWAAESGHRVLEQMVGSLRRA